MNFVGLVMILAGYKTPTKGAENSGGVGQAIPDATGADVDFELFRDSSNAMDYSPTSDFWSEM